MRNLAIAAAVAATSISATSSAAIIVFTNNSVWTNFVTNGGASIATENFESFNGFYASPLTGSLAGVNWSATAAGGVYVGAVGSSQSLSTNNPTPLAISFGAGQVQGVSGNIYGTDINFNVVPSIVQVSLANGTSYIGFVDSATAFVGFWSTDAAITGVTISAQPVGTGDVYPTLDNMAIAVVPAPGAVALLALAGLVGRRRR